MYGALVFGVMLLLLTAVVRHRDADVRRRLIEGIATLGIFIAAMLALILALSQEPSTSDAQNAGYPQASCAESTRPGC